MEGVTVQRDERVARDVHTHALVAGEVRELREQGDARRDSAAGLERAALLRAGFADAQLLGPRRKIADEKQDRAWHQRLAVLERADLALIVLCRLIATAGDQKDAQAGQETTRRGHSVARVPAPWNG